MQTFLEEMCNNSGLPAYLSKDTGNKRAIKFYDRLGFVETDSFTPLDEDNQIAMMCSAKTGAAQATHAPNASTPPEPHA